jgi:hypothetical protein
VRIYGDSNPDLLRARHGKKARTRRSEPDTRRPAQEHGLIGASVSSGSSRVTGSGNACRQGTPKVLAGIQAEVKDVHWKIFDTGDLKTPPGPELVKIIDARIGAFAAKYRAAYLAAVNRRGPDRLAAPGQLSETSRSASDGW